MNEGWKYLTNAEAATPFSLCVLIFALFMIPGGRIQDKFGPKVGAITGGLFLALGCIIAGVTKSYAGLIVGFGILGGIGMGIGYAAPTPAALKWFGPHKRGLIAGLVVGGYGGAALYIAPLGRAPAEQRVVSPTASSGWEFSLLSSSSLPAVCWPGRRKAMCPRPRPWWAVWLPKRPAPWLTGSPPT